MSDANIRKSMVYRPGLECVYDEGALPEGMDSVDEGAVLHLQKQLSAANVPSIAEDWLKLGGGGSVEGIPIIEETGEESLSFEIPVGYLLKIDKPLVSGDVLTLSMGEPKEGFAGKYMVEFFVKDSSATVSWPDDVFFPTPLVPSSNSRYQIAIANNIATSIVRIPVPDYFYVERLGDESGSSINIYSESDYGQQPPTYGLEYSRDKKNWTALSIDANLDVIEDVAEIGEKVYFRGTNTNIMKLRIKPDFGYAIGGDITTMLDPVGGIETPERNVFKDMFYERSTSQDPTEGAHYLVSAENLVLPAKTVVDNGYYSMFESCENLLTPPAELPALELGEYAYRSMFMNCEAMTTVPVIKAISASTESLGWMFSDCHELTDLSAMKLPMTSYPEFCCDNMFSWCEKLAKAPQMTIEGMENEAFYSMFYDCGLLEDISGISVTAATAAVDAFSFMFEGCANLNMVLDLSSVTVFERGACVGMYRDCTSLQSAQNINFNEDAELSHEDPASSYDHNTGIFEAMFYGCSALRTGPEMPFDTLTKYCCRVMYKDCVRLEEVYISATDIDATDCLKDWLSGASSFAYLHNIGGKELEYGTSGLPRNWAEIRDPKSSEYDSSVAIYYKLLDGTLIAPPLVAIGAPADEYKAPLLDFYTALNPKRQWLRAAIPGKEICYVFWYEEEEE